MTLDWLEDVFRKADVHAASVQWTPVPDDELAVRSPPLAAELELLRRNASLKENAE